jgi:hypothetical protein
MPRNGQLNSTGRGCGGGPGCGTTASGLLQVDAGGAAQEAHARAAGLTGEALKALEGLDPEATAGDVARLLGGASQVSPALLALMEALRAQAGGLGAVTAAVDGFGSFEQEYQQIEKVSAHHGDNWEVLLYGHLLAATLFAHVAAALRVHRLDGEPGRDPLVQGREHAHPQLPVQGGLADEDPGERGRRVHLGVREQPELFELGRVQEVRLDDDHYAAVPFGGLGGEQVGGLGHQLGLEVAGLGAEGPHDRDVESPGAERGVGDVDDLVAGGVQGGDGGADRDSFPRSDIARDDPERGYR